MAGVASANVYDDAESPQLAVALSPSVTSAEVTAIAAAAQRFLDRERTERPATTAELRFGESTFSHFDREQPADMTGEQAAYWLGLSRAGLPRVDFRHATGGMPASGPDIGPSAMPSPSTGNVPVFNSGGGRLVTIDLPPAPIDRVLSVVDDARRIVDPGARRGQWEVSGLGDGVTAEFVTPNFPDRSDVAKVAAWGALKPTSVESALRVRMEHRAAYPVQVSLTAFDRSFASATRATAETVARRSPLWPGVAALMREVDATGGNWSLDVLGSPLSDAGNFALDVSVSDCAFRRDASWPGLSNELAAQWVELRRTRNTEQFAAQRCRVEALV